MVHITIGAGSKRTRNEKLAHTRNKTPTTLAAFAGFYLVPYALRKAAICSRERREKPGGNERRRGENVENTEKTEIVVDRRHDSAVISSVPDLGTPLLGANGDIRVPGPVTSPAEEDVRRVHDGNESWGRFVEDEEEEDGLNPVAMSSLGSAGSGEVVHTLGTKLSDLQEVVEMGEDVDGPALGPVPARGPTSMWGRGV